MKRNYLILLLISVFGMQNADAQACPEVSVVVALPTEEILFAFDSSGPPCGTRPAAIVVDGSAYILGNCDEFSSRYVLSSGSGVIDPDSYTVTYGGSNCEYTSGSLGLDDIFKLNKNSLTLYPNPVSNSNYLNVKFAISMSAKINVYDLSGKLLLRDQIQNSNSKDLDVSVLANGVYLLKLDTGEASITSKFLVNN